MSNKIKLEVPNEISYVIVQCFSKAREEIREYTGKQNFITKNGIPFQFWDLLNNAIDTALIVLILKRINLNVDVGE